MRALILAQSMIRYRNKSLAIAGVSYRCRSVGCRASPKLGRLMFCPTQYLWYRRKLSATSPRGISWLLTRPAGETIHQRFMDGTHIVAKVNCRCSVYSVSSRWKRISCSLVAGYLLSVAAFGGSARCQLRYPGRLERLVCISTTSNALRGDTVEVCTDPQYIVRRAYSAFIRSWYSASKSVSE